MKNKKTLALVCGVMMITGNIFVPIATANPIPTANSFLENINEVLSNAQLARQGDDTAALQKSLADVRKITTEVPSEPAQKETLDAAYPKLDVETLKHPVWDLVLTRYTDDASSAHRSLKAGLEHLLDVLERFFGRYQSVLRARHAAERSFAQLGGFLSLAADLADAYETLGAPFVPGIGIATKRI
jgi:hypothetical protein